MPLELVPFAVQTTLRALGSAARLRDVPAEPRRRPDRRLPRPRSATRARWPRGSSATPGVVEHGLFAPEMVSSVLIAGAEGVRRRAGAKREG